MKTSELLEFIASEPTKKGCKCRYEKFKAWSEFPKEITSNLEYLGELENPLSPKEIKTVPFPGFNYWHESYPIALDYYPQAHSDVLRCKSCNAIFLTYLELSGRATECKKTVLTKNV